MQVASFVHLTSNTSAIFLQFFLSRYPEALLATSLWQNSRGSFLLSLWTEGFDSVTGQGFACGTLELAS